MKVGILESIEHLVVKEMPDPELERGSVILKVEVCSICNSDLRIYHHGHAKVELPQILGHEIAGQVEAVAEGVTNYRAGDLITHTFPLDSIEKAFLFAESREGMHVAICP